MKHLLNTLFVTSEDIYLSLDGENVVANREHQEVARYPLHTLAGIISFSYPGHPPLSWVPVRSRTSRWHFVPPGTLLGPRYRSKFGKCTASPYPVPNRR